jgi:hypothetical protein
MTTAGRQRALYDALAAVGFNQTHAARILGVSRETVRQRLLAAGGLDGLCTWAMTNGSAAVAAPGGNDMATTTSSNSSVQVGGENRAFLKRIALEVTLQAGTAREDMSHVVALMIEHFRRQGDAAAVASMLLAAAADELRVSA